MKTYCVNLKETSYGFVEVQADNEEEAKEIAYKAWLDGNANMVGSVDCEPLSVSVHVLKNPSTRLVGVEAEDRVSLDII